MIIKLIDEYNEGVEVEATEEGLILTGRAEAGCVSTPSFLLSWHQIDYLRAEVKC